MGSHLVWFSAAYAFVSYYICKILSCCWIWLHFLGVHCYDIPVVSEYTRYLVYGGRGDSSSISDIGFEVSVRVLVGVWGDRRTC